MASSESHHTTTGSGEAAKKHSTSELMASAKVVAEAAQSGFGPGADGKAVDKGKVADAAGDLLDAVGDYAKLDHQKGMGQYVDKAADYLHHYHPTTTTAATGDHPTSKPDHHKSDDAAKTDGGESGGHGHGLGDFAKTAGGFFHK
ncbi:nodulin-related protein 2-like [Vicia villosa]|uniref:nodulin-related protein 2-like n=1 Tax=Vicia villosa TaxID=3911 RepID=UPI00273AE56B|nr:nodulin-related protein 2-like [Vicia villosa]